MLQISLQALQGGPRACRISTRPLIARIVTNAGGQDPRNPRDSGYPGYRPGPGPQDPSWGSRDLYKDISFPEPSAPPMPDSLMPGHPRAWEGGPGSGVDAGRPPVEPPRGEDPWGQQGGGKGYRDVQVDWGTIGSRTEEDRRRPQSRSTAPHRAAGSGGPLPSPSPAPKTFRKAFSGWFFKLLLSAAFVTWTGAVLWQSSALPKSVAVWLAGLPPLLLSVWVLQGYYKVQLYKESEAKPLLGYLSTGQVSTDVVSTPLRTGERGQQSPIARAASTAGRPFRRLLVVLIQSFPLLVLNATLWFAQASVLGLVDVRKVPLLSLVATWALAACGFTTVFAEVQLETAELRAMREAREAAAKATSQVVF